MLSPEELKEIDHELEHYEQASAATIEAADSNEAMDAIKFAAGGVPVVAEERDHRTARRRQCRVVEPAHGLPHRGLGLDHDELLGSSIERQNVDLPRARETPLLVQKQEIVLQHQPVL